MGTPKKKKLKNVGPKVNDVNDNTPASKAMLDAVYGRTPWNPKGSLGS